MNPLVWIRPPAGSDAKHVVTTALERGLDTFVLPPDANADDLRQLGKLHAITFDGDTVLRDGEAVGRRAEVASKAEQADALDLAGEADLVVLSATDWKVIPAENLIAAYQPTKTRLLVEAASVEEARLLLETLEVGADGVVLRADTPEDVLAITHYLATREGHRVSLETARVTAVRPVGSGDRACLDTASLLKVGEGMLLGSTSSALFLVHSESLESEYVSSRPFRVNAGPVHAYVLLPEGRTKYLSEVRAGDEVLVVDRDGHTRTAVLGRVKIETRPLLLVEAEVDGREVSTLLQNAETVRLVSPDGPVSVSALAPGDEVLVRVETGGRHFGSAVDETITEA